ncbi:MAG: putative galactose-phosphate uridylyltransferase [Ilumatobacteraceae bacterium]|nr:putative galactose-phosphate uridylyltransferase [Ilumatobacteraceae bacterium]
MSQLRLNPLTGRWVTIVSERAGRPTDFRPRTAEVESDPARPCPFCPGNEEATLPALETVDEGGSWKIRVIPNLYPAFDGDEPFAVHHLGPVHVEAEASGIHEVLVISPFHDLRGHPLTDSDAAEMMHVIKRRLEEHALTPNVRYTQAIINHGREAGASIAHPHGQLLGLPFVPGEILDEQRAFSRFEGGCILCATVETELVDGKRVLFANDDVVCVCPYWSGTPYELLIIPRRHELHLTDASNESLTSFGLAIRDSLDMMRELHGDVSYNMVFHTAPHHYHGAYHWHLHLFPKLVTTAGFERGTGVMINIMPPEIAAEQLRHVSIKA